MTTSEQKDEYLDASENMRHYGNMRFAQLTLFTGASAGLLGIAFTASSLSFHQRIALCVGGILVTLAFWVMDRRINLYFDSYCRRAVQLEQSLGFSQHTNRPGGKVLTSAKAVGLLFLSSTLLWLVVLFGL